MKKLIATIILLGCIVTACKKSGEHPDGLVGTWKWQRTSGGLVGMNHTSASTGKTVILQFNADSTYTNTINSVMDTQGKISLGQDPFAKVSSYKYIEFSGGLKTEYATKITGELCRVIADTLYLGDGPNISDGFDNIYIRVK